MMINFSRNFYESFPEWLDYTFACWKLTLNQCKQIKQTNVHIIIIALMASLFLQPPLVCASWTIGCVFLYILITLWAATVSPLPTWLLIGWRGESCDLLLVGAMWPHFHGIWLVLLGTGGIIMWYREQWCSTGAK